MKKYSIYVLFFLVMIAVLISQNRFRNRENNIIIRELSKEKSFFLDHPNDNPDKFAEYHKKIRTRRGEDLPGYRPGYLEKEYADAYARAKNASHRKNEYAWQERGPSNVPGRTRGIIQLPGDPDKLTWLAGSVGGGIWKTEDGGKNWVNKTPSLPNLATTSLAYSEANPDIIYAGTGESYGAGGLIEIVGQGIYKSLDGGESWSPLITSTDLFRFMAVNRIMVDPVNPDILIISANQNIGRGLSFKSGIYKSTDGGNTWDKVFEPNGWIQQVLYEPGNFTIQYAGVYGNGIAKSVDAGHSWTLITNGIFPSGRIELAVSPGNTQVLYAAVEGERSGVDSDFYISEDGGENWKLVVEQNNLANRNFFAATASSPAQGGWNNTIAVHPFYDSIIYVGGVDLWKMEMLSGEEIGERDFLGVKEEGTGDFMTFVSFNSGGYWADRLATGNLDESRFVTVEIRFGQGKRQMAHRFETPSDGEPTAMGGPASRMRITNIRIMLKCHSRFGILKMIGN